MMARHARPRTGSASDSDDQNDTNSESDSNSNSDNDSSDNSDDGASEPVQPRQRRKDLRWLHAGLFKDAKEEIKDIWYAFRKNKSGRYQIIYASDWMGTAFENLEVGRRKSDLITWDKHHAEKWSRFITARGTWLCKRATVGRAFQRDSLLQTWLDPNSPNLFRRGKERNRILGPPLNVIHSTVDDSPSGTAPRPIEQAEASPEGCYPDTTIPFSTIRIVVGAYKDYNKDALTVIADFLTGQLARDVKFRRHRTSRNDQVESAFYECGWRVNRRALEKVNDSILLGKTENVYQSKAWRNAPPLWVDKYKGDQLNTLLNQMREDMGEFGESDDVDSDDESSDTAVETPARSDSESQLDSQFAPSKDGHRSLTTVAGPSRRKANPKAAKAKSDPKISSKSGKPKTSNRSVTKRLWKSIENSDRYDSTDEELDYLPENSREKGKGRAVKKPRLRKQIAEASSDEEDDEELEEKQAAVIAARRSPSPVPGIPNKSAVTYIDPSDDDSDIEILEHLSTPVGPKAEQPSYYDALHPLNFTASSL